MNKNKISEFDIDIKKLEGVSSSKVKRDLVEAKRKIERQYTPAKLKALGSVREVSNDIQGD